MIGFDSYSLVFTTFMISPPFPLALRSSTHAHHFMPTTLRIYLVAYIGLLKKEMHMGGAFTFTDDMKNVMLTYTELRLYVLICMYIVA